MRGYAVVILAFLLLFATPAFADDGMLSRDVFGGEGQDQSADSGSGEFVFSDAPAGGGSSWEEFYVQDVDLSGFMERLYFVMTDEAHFGYHPESLQIAEFLKKMGFFDIKSSHTEYQLTGDRIRVFDATEFAGGSDTYYGKLFAIPDGEVRSAKYVQPGSYLMYIAMTGMIEKALLGLENPILSDDSPLGELMDIGGGDMEMEQAMAMVKAMKLDELLGSTLSGEIALVLYGTPPLANMFEGDIEPDDIELALMVGIDDPEYVLEMATAYGADIGLMPVEMDDEKWHGFVMAGQESVGIAFNDEILIATPSAELVAPRVKAAMNSGGMDLDPCQMYIDMDMARLHDDILLPLLGIAEAELGDEVVLPVDSLAYLLNLPDSQALGHLTMVQSNVEGNSYFELEMKKAVIQYLVHYLGLAGIGAAHAGVFD